MQLGGHLAVHTPANTVLCDCVISRQALTRFRSLRWLFNMSPGGLKHEVCAYVWYTMEAMREPDRTGKKRRDGEMLLRTHLRVQSTHNATSRNNTCTEVQGKGTALVT
jgi:hypothetical protein